MSQLANLDLGADALISMADDIERELGARSFYEFVRMAWRYVDPAPFIDNWHIREVCALLQAVATRQAPDHVICVPPRSSKSLLVSVLWPAWIWTWWPASKFITASYDIRLATRDAVKARRLISTPWYQRLWPLALADDQNNKTFYQNSEGGHRFVSSPSAGITGEGADFLLFDDPHSVNQGESPADRQKALDFWFEAAPSRLNNLADGRKLVIQQRVHESDVAGECIRRGWQHFVVPALFERDHPQIDHRDPRTEDGESYWPERFPPPAMRGLMDALGSYAAAGQYQQRPAPREGGLFKRHWFGVVPVAPNAVQRKVRRWDLAASEKKATNQDPDYTVGVLMSRTAAGIYYIEDVQRMRATPQAVETAIKNTAQQDGSTVTIGLPLDPGAAGKAQQVYLSRALAGWALRWESESGDKYTRAQGFSAQCEVGNIKLVAGDWNKDFLDEICGFPTASHDDQVDAAGGAFRMLVGSSTGLLDFYAKYEGQG